MVRPPLVGQASSSSNESRQSLSSETEDFQEDRNISPLSRSTSERFPEHISGNYYVDVQNRHPSHYLSNREDYISAKPPEGSSDHSLVSTNTAEPSSDGGPRISSPASSVTSVRPLEWDSGADVGYQQNYLESVQRLDPVFSTIERLAIVQGTTALLTRSDPEGTTEPSAQPVAKTIVKMKKMSKDNDSVGLPKAQSTPFSTFMPSNENFMGNRDVFSPIAQMNNQTPPILVHQGPTHEVPNINNPNKPGNKYALFPELKSVKEVTTYDSKLTDNLTNLREGRTFFQESSDIEIKNSTSKSSTLRSSSSNSHQINNPKTHFKSPINSIPHSASSSTLTTAKDLDDFKHLENSERNFGIYNKKLSSSLEDIRDLDKLVVGSIAQPNTLPRSQSQNNILSDNDDKVCSTHEIKNRSKNMVMHNFPFTTNKSASSSSVATVVQNKNDSPLHVSKLVHSTLLKQPIGIQECEQQNQIYELKPTSSETQSNYFIQKLRRSDQDKCIGDTELHLDQCHKGIACKGAHKKFGTSVESYEMLGRMSNTSDSKSNQNPPVLTENTRYQESTLDSIESSSKSRGFSTDRQDSMTAEDRVNSFEYLPGHVFETGKQLRSNSTSSVSAACKNSIQNIENLWDTEDSINLTKDINRGVEIIKDVVRNKNTSDNEMKKKVIQLVVEKLINTNYAEDDFRRANLDSNVPWVPPILEHLTDSKFKRKERSKVPGELSSLTDTSRVTSNTSSECFKPKPGILRDIGKTKHHFIDKCIGTGESLTLSRKTYTTSETNTSAESTCVTEPQTSTNTKTKKSSMDKENEDNSLGSTSTSSLKYDKRYWREPVTKAEQLYEHKRKLLKEKAKNSIENNKVVQFLDLEKKTQLMRIDIEMQHLNNLRKLLSKTEELKENMKDLKKSRARAVELSHRESETKHSSKYTTTATPFHHRKDPGSPSKRKLASRQYKPNLRLSLNNAKTASESNTSPEAAAKSSKAQEIRNDWSSHHYLSEDRELQAVHKSRQEPKTKSFNSELINRKRDAQINGSVASPSKAKAKHRHSESTLKSNTRTGLGINSEDSLLLANILRRRNLQNLHSVGVQTSNNLEQNKSNKDDKMNNCECVKVCGCCKENRCCSNKKFTKQPVGYYITFQSEPSSDQVISEKPSLEEVRLPVPVSKSRPTEQKQNGVKKDVDRRKTDTCSSSDSDIDVHHHKPTLQDYLLDNRPDYIHRANDRRQCIAQLSYLRELRDQSKRRLLALSQPMLPRELPPPPLAVKRLFSQKRMRQQTERKYKQLSEVQNKQHDTKRKEAYRTNRLMAEVFTKKLQKRVLKGEVNLSNSVSVITTL